MRALFTSPALFGEPGVFGGGERYAACLARAVAERTGGASLLAAAERDEERQDGPLRVLARRPWCYIRGQRTNPLPRGLWEALRGADVVHCFQWRITMTTAAIFEGRLRRAPVFVTDLGGGGYDLSGYVDTARFATGLLHLSSYAQGLSGRAGSPHDAVLYGGSDGLRERAAGGGGGGPTVLFVGRLLPHKGVDVLLEAAEAGWEVELVGAPLDARYRDDLHQLAAGKRVSFRGAVSDAELEEAYARAAVVVVPSVYRNRYGQETAVPELLGLVAIEAGARGIPVVASRVASLPEVVEDGVTGLLVPPGDPAALREAVGALLRDPPQRERLGRAAQQRVSERFTWGRAAEVALAAYGGALGGKR